MQICQVQLDRAYALLPGDTLTVTYDGPVPPESITKAVNDGWLVPLEPTQKSAPPVVVYPTRYDRSDAC